MFWKRTASGAGTRRASSSRPLAAHAPAEESRGMLEVQAFGKPMQIFRARTVTGDVEPKFWFYRDRDRQRM